MKDEPKCLEMDHLEQGTLINALNQMRTDQLEQGRPTDAVDDLLLKVIDAPSKRERLIEKWRSRDETR